VLHHRLVHHRHHGFRDVARKRAEPCPKSARHDNSFHRSEVVSRKRDTTSMKNSTNKKIGLQPSADTLWEIAEHFFESIIEHFGVAW